MSVKELIQVLVDQNNLLIKQQKELITNKRIDDEEKHRLILEYSKTIKENIRKIKELKNSNKFKYKVKEKSYV